MAVKRYNGTSWVTEAGGVPAFLGGFRNRIINGDFRINQRGYTSASNLASGSYGFDRWKSNFTNTTLTFTSAPQGQQVTINSGGGLQQVIEQANMPAGTYVLSWSGTATGRVYNSGGTAPAYAASPLTVVVDGTANVVVEFTASGATKTLQNVQLELGVVPTPFEQRPIGTELALCQRYYNASVAGMGRSGSTSNLEINYIFPVTMRVVPLAYVGPSPNSSVWQFGVAAVNVTGISVTWQPSTSSMGVTMTTSGSGFTVGTVAGAQGGSIAFNAEL